MSIDIHNHAIPKATLELVTSDPVYGVSVVDGEWRSGNIANFPLIDAWHDPAAKLREMDSLELDGAVLSAAPKPLYFYELELAPQRTVAEVTNRGLAEMARAHTDRLRWMATVPLAYPEAAIAVLREAVAQGATGVEIGTSAAGRRLDEEEFEPFWSACEEMGVNVFMHPAYEADLPVYKQWHLGAIIGLPVEVTIALERMICSHMLDRHPRLCIVAGLGGGFFPYNAGRLRHYAGYHQGLKGVPRDPWSYVGQIKFDSFLHDAGQIRFLIEQAGAENVLIGTDCSFPSHPPAPMAELRAAADGDEAVISQIAETNPRNLFWS